MSPQATATNAPSIEGDLIEIRRRGGEVYAWCGALGLHASAASADAAIAALDEKRAKLREFEARSGLGGTSRQVAWRSGLPREGLLRRIGIPALIGGLVAMQLGWALSLGVSNGLGRTFNSSWRDSLVESLEKQVLSLAEPRHELGAEQQKRLIEAVRALKTRYGPVWDEIVAAPAPGTP